MLTGKVAEDINIYNIVSGVKKPNSIYDIQIHAKLWIFSAFWEPEEIVDLMNQYREYKDQIQ